jgi:hypothetical protein
MNNQQELIDNLYLAFNCYARPEHFTDYKHCDECLEHDQTMNSADLKTLNGSHVGTAGWSPFSFLTTEGFGYYMPRLLELSVRREKNKHGESVLSILLFHLAPSKDYDRFSGYSDVQRKVVLEALKLMLERHQSEIVEEFIQEDLESAIKYWQTIT